MTDYKLIEYDIKRKHDAINAISYCKKINCIVIGRENGLVEMYDTSQNFLLLWTIVASNINAVDAIMFIKFNDEMKVVGVASSKLFLIDVSSMTITDEITLLNNLPGRSLSQCGENLLAVGCDSGYVCIYEFYCELRLMKTIREMENVILSLAWSNLFKNELIAGSFDRVYKINLETNNVIYHDVLREVKKKGLVGTTLIMCAIYCGRYLCTGDSRGCIIVWDPIHLGILHQFKTHETSILSIAFDDQHTIYVCGSDPTIVTVDLENNLITDKRYGMQGSIRGLSFTNKSIVAVGTSGSINVYDSVPLSNCFISKFFKVEYNYQYECHYHKETRSYVTFFYNNKSIEIYQQYYRESTKTDNLQRIRLLLAVKPKNHIQAFSVSNDLKYLAYSTNVETRILKLYIEVDDKENIKLMSSRYYATSDAFQKSSKKTVKAEGRSAVLQPASILKFVTCNQSLFLVLVGQLMKRKEDNNQISIYEIVHELQGPILRTGIIYKNENNFNNAHMVVANDIGTMIAISTLDGRVLVYSLETFGFLLKISLKDTAGNISPPRATAMCFNMTNKRIVIMSTDKQILDVHIQKNMKSVWSQDFNRHFPTDWLKAKNVHEIIPVTANIFFLLIGKKIIAKLDMNKKPPARDASLFRKNHMHNLGNVKRTIQLKEAKIIKLKSMRTSLKAQNKLDGVPHIESRIKKIKDNIEELKNVDNKPDIDGCFTWQTLRKYVIGLKYLIQEKVILCLYEDREDFEEESVIKKAFKV